MKSIMLTLAALLVFALATPTLAQTQPKVYNDVTVHPHNYKHPNKAAMRPVKGIEFREGVRRSQTIADYKENQRRGGQLNATIAVPARDVAVTENRNYKQQNQLVKPKKQKEPVIEPVTQEAIGN